MLLTVECLGKKRDKIKSIIMHNVSRKKNPQAYCSYASSSIKCTKMKSKEDLPSVIALET